MAGRPGAGAFLGLALGLLAPAALAAYETDQYSNRLQPIRDSGPALDQMVERVLESVVAGWHGPLSTPAERWRFARRIYWRLGGLYWVDRIEAWAMKSPEVEKLPQHRRHSIFRDAPFWATRVNYLFGVGRTIQVDGVLLGSDKLGHFFSQGVKYFASHLLGESDADVVDRGRYNERWLFGALTTGVYSNADLVANYEGYLFYRGLFEDGVVAGKPAMVTVRDGRAVLTRPFSWADHVNDFWDEALNPSRFDPALDAYMRRALRELCADYRRAPQRYVSAQQPALETRYANIALEPNPALRVDAVCGTAAAR